MKAKLQILLLQASLVGSFFFFEKKRILIISIGNHAQGKYASRLTEWPNFMKSDVLYCPMKTVKSNKLPPLLVEVQYTANMAFFRRLMEYSLSINKHYHALPVVLAICVHNTTSDLMELSTPSSTLPFLVELPCVGWAKSCYLMNAGSIAKHLQEIPLNPFVAVGHFLIEQKPSLADMIHRDDKTIIMLYELAKKVFGDQVEQDAANSLKNVYNELNKRCNTAKQFLLEDVQDMESRKRTLDCLDQALLYIDTHLPKKHNSIANSSSSMDQDDPNKNKDWTFVERHQQNHGALDWKAIFEIGKQKGLFNNYGTWKSVKAAYYRAKAKRHP